MGASTPAFRNRAEASRAEGARAALPAATSSRRWAALIAIGFSLCCAPRAASELAASPEPTARAAPPTEAPATSELRASSAGATAPPGPDARALQAGDAALELGHLDEAREEYARARTLAPTSPGGALGLLRVRFARLGLGSEYAEAPRHPELERLLTELDALLSEHPDDAAAQLERARWLIVLGDAERALSSASAAARLAPAQPEAYSVLGVAQLATGHAQAALDALETADRLGPGDPDRLMNLGTAYMLRGRVTDAIATFRRAVTLVPDDARANGDLGAALLADGRFEDALPYLLRAAELAPGRATFLTNLGYAYQKRGELDRAVETQRRALALDPALGSAWINLGNALAEQGDVTGATAALRRAEELDPSDPRPKASLRDLAELQGHARPTAP